MLHSLNTSARERFDVSSTVHRSSRVSVCMSVCLSVRLSVVSPVNFPLIITAYFCYFLKPSARCLSFSQTQKTRLSAVRHLVVHHSVGNTVSFKFVLNCKRWKLAPHCHLRSPVSPVVLGF